MTISQAEFNITIRSNNYIYRRSITLALVVIYSISGILFIVLAGYVACCLKIKHLRHIPCVGSTTKKRERKKELQKRRAQRDAMAIGILVPANSRIGVAIRFINLTPRHLQTIVGALKLCRYMPDGQVKDKNSVLLREALEPQYMQSKEGGQDTPSLYPHRQQDDDRN